jgi:hypothetical protein
MKAATAKSPLRRSPKARKKAARPANEAAKPWTPPDFAQRRLQDFDDKLMPFSYVDFIER